MITRFENLREGDFVRLTSPDDDGVAQEMTGTVRDPELGAYGWQVHVDGTYYEVDGYTVELINYADGLPDTEYIAWADSDGQKHVALRLPTGTWMFDGEPYARRDLVIVVDGADVFPLTVRR